MAESSQNVLYGDYSSIYEELGNIIAYNEFEFYGKPLKNFGWEVINGDKGTIELVKGGYKDPESDHSLKLTPTNYGN